MVCEHLQELYQLCHDQKIVISSSDLVKVVCKQCDEHEVCPSVLMDEYDARSESANPLNNTSAATTSEPASQSQHDSV